MKDLHGRAKQGIKMLMGRQVCVQVLTFAGGIVLARTLGPALFGLYAIAAFLVNSLAQFGDFGLAPSFIQRKAELTERDLQVGFTMQQALTTVVVAVLFVAAPWLIKLYPKAPPETVWLVRTLVFSLYFSSWRAISALQLERQLRYDRLAWVEVAEAVSYQGIAVSLALMGCGVWSLVWATLTRGVLGAVLVYLVAPWTPRLRYDAGVARDILRFGVPFQVANLIAGAGNWVSPLLVGSIIGPQAVGYLGWAASNGNKPLSLIDNVTRVVFPHFSRIQEDRPEVERLLFLYLTYLLVPAGLWVVLLTGVGHAATRWIYTDKWTPAVSALIVYSIGMFFHVTTWMVGTVLNGLGMIRYNTRIVTIRSLLQISLGIPLVLVFGFIGIPFALLLVEAASLPITVAGLGRGVFPRLVGHLSWLAVPIAAGLLAGFGASRVGLPSGVHAVFACCIVFAAYSAGVWVAGPQTLRTLIVKRFQKLPPGVLTES